MTSPCGRIVAVAAFLFGLATSGVSRCGRSGFRISTSRLRQRISPPLLRWRRQICIHFARTVGCGWLKHRAFSFSRVPCNRHCTFCWLYLGLDASGILARRSSTGRGRAVCVARPVQCAERFRGCQSSRVFPDRKSSALSFVLVARHRDFRSGNAGAFLPASSAF